MFSASGAVGVGFVGFGGGGTSSVCTCTACVAGSRAAACVDAHHTELMVCSQEVQVVISCTFPCARAPATLSLSHSADNCQAGCNKDPGVRMNY